MKKIAELEVTDNKKLVLSIGEFSRDVDQSGVGSGLVAALLSIFRPPKIM